MIESDLIEFIDALLDLHFEDGAIGNFFRSDMDAGEYNRFECFDHLDRISLRIGETQFALRSIGRGINPESRGHALLLRQLLRGPRSDCISDHPEEAGIFLRRRDRLVHQRLQICIDHPHQRFWRTKNKTHARMPAHMGFFHIGEVNQGTIERCKYREFGELKDR